MRALLFLFLVFGILRIQAQSLELETLPASVKWNQIKSPHFQVIFPKGFEPEANRTTNILESIYEPASQSLGVKPRRFSIILQNQNAISNGFVTIGPRRSEFFTTSPQDNRFLGNADWLEFLAVHEYRHMVQFEKAYHSPINKLMYVGFGEYGVGFAAGIAAPSWFWEGDAVGTETAFTATGRGRTPYFERAFKTNILEKGGFNYYKQHLTSFNDFVPNHYRTGYFMTTYLKRKYGADIWDKIVKRSFRFPFLPFVFSNAIKKETGQNLLQTYEGMISEMRDLYSDQINSIEENPGNRINTRKNNVYTNYEYPNSMPDGSVIAIKSGFSDIDQFVRIDKNGNEEVVFTPGLVNDPGLLSIKDDKILWAEYEFDPRWLKKSYSVIKTFDLKTQKFRRVTSKSKYVAAALSPDGQVIAAVQSSTDGSHAIHLLDYASGELKASFANADSGHYSMPSFSQDGKSILAIKYVNRIKSLVRKGVNTGEEEVILQSEKENFGHPVHFEEYILYNSPVNGIDNIYAVEITSRSIYQVTDSKFGAYNPSIAAGGKTLVYNEFTKDGMDIVALALEVKKWIPIEKIEDRNISYAEPMVEQEGHSHVLENQQGVSYEIQRYKKLPHSIRPHSWGVSALPIGGSVVLGVNSKDILSTTTISAGLQYDYDERNWLKFASLSYQGLYPILDFSITSGERSTKINTDSGTERHSWDETSLSAGVRVPLVLTRSKYLRKLTLSAKTIFTSVSEFTLEPQSFIDQPGNGSLRALEYKIRYINRLKRSKLDLDSRFGQSLMISFKNTPIGGDYSSRLFAAESNLYFPGLVRHHSIRLRGSYQSENSTNYFFDSPIRFTRGVGYFPFESFSNLSINYKMPLWYPDIHIGPLLNIQRLYINGFYDSGRGKIDNAPTFTFDSYGAELSMNFNMMRFLLHFDMGIRYAYVPDFNERRVELIIGGFTL